jgi:hypothetical protein
MPTIHCKDKSFESKYSNTEAESRLLLLVDQGKIRNTFPVSVATGIRRYGRATPHQLPYVHLFVYEAEQNQPAQPTGPGTFITIVDHLTKCRKLPGEGGKGLLHPCLQLKSGEQKIVLKLLGKQSKNCGGVSIASERGFGKGDYYGHISKDGYIQASRNMTREICAILERIAVNPATVISQLGRETGHCCYCFAPLTTVQSRIAGCGDTCASNYDVWYPNAAETRGFLSEHPEVLEGATDAERWV